MPGEGYDIDRTCPQARWHQSGEYSIPGLPLCACVTPSKGEQQAFSVSYFLFCRVNQQTRHGLYDDVANATQEIQFWLNAFRCPGQIVPDQDITPRGP